MREGIIADDHRPAHSTKEPEHARRIFKSAVLKQVRLRLSIPLAERNSRHARIMEIAAPERARFILPARPDLRPEAAFAKDTILRDKIRRDVKRRGVSILRSHMLQAHLPQPCAPRIDYLAAITMHVDRVERHIIHI